MEERDDDAFDERAMEQAGKWKQEHRGGEDPPADASAETQPAPGVAAFHEQRDTLHREEAGRAAVAAAGRQRDH